MRATLVVMPAVTLSGCGGVLASSEVMISGGMQPGLPPLMGTAACASTGEENIAARGRSDCQTA